MNSDTICQTNSLQFFVQLARQVIGMVIIHEKFTFTTVNNVSDWEHPELSFTFV